MTIAIIGAGVVGLSTARELAEAGEAVIVVDGGTIAGGASAAATAYLEPRLGETPIKRLEQEALARWTDYAAGLEAGFGAIGFRTDGQLRVALPEQADAFVADMKQREALGWTILWLTPEEARALEPVLSADIAAASRLPDMRSVDGRAVCEALVQAIRAHGGEVREHWPVGRIAQDGAGLVLHGPNGETLVADKVLVATGYTESPIDGMPADVPPTRPVRGVNLVYDRADLPVDLFVKHKRGYLCPRGDHVLVGTTHDNGVADPDPDDAVIEKLLANAEGIVPDIRTRPLKTVTAGIRAKAGDGTPAFGTSRHMPGLTWSLGHAGAGYLRAPVFAPELAAYLRDGTVGEWMGRAKLL